MFDLCSGERNDGMFEFFIALFGGLFYGGKMVQESSNNRAFDKHMDVVRDWDNLLGTNGFHSKAAMDIENKLQNPKERAELLETIKDEMEFVFGDAWRYDLPPYKNSADTVSITESPWGLIYRILLSKEGQLGFGDTTYNFWWCFDEMLIKRIIKACIIIERNIKQYYPELSLLYMPNSYFGGQPGSILRNGEIRWSYAIPEISMPRTRSLQHILKYGEYI